MSGGWRGCANPSSDCDFENTVVSLTHAVIVLPQKPYYEVWILGQFNK